MSLVKKQQGHAACCVRQPWCPPLLSVKGSWVLPLRKSCKTSHLVWYESACNGNLTAMKQSSLDLNLSTKKTRKQELLAQVEDEEILREMLRRCLAALEEVDMLADLPPAMLAALERAIKESYDESDLISNDLVTQMAQKL